MTHAPFHDAPKSDRRLLRSEKRRGKLILVIRTDKEKAELYLYEDQKPLTEIKWQAHRQLAETIHKKLAEILNRLSISIDDVEGVVCFQGPGSFTGLRIG